MTTLAELVAENPDETHGVPVDLDYGGGGFRAVVQIADPDAGASVVWHDISDRISDIRWRFGASQPRGNQEAGSSTLMLWTTDDTFAPWNEDTSATFGVHVPLNAGLLIRFGVFRGSGASMQWWPQFTHLVRRWGDSSAALGNVRYHKIEAVDLASTLANKPIGATIEQGHIARIAVLLETWPFGYQAYGVDTTDGTTPALTYPARTAQASILSELRLACRNAGLVVRSQKNGQLIIHPAPRDTWNADQRALPGATGATWSNPIFTYYFGGVYFTYEPAVLGDVLFWPEMAGSSFGIESDWEHVVNELTVSTPAGLYSFDDPVSASKFGDRSLPRETWLAENDQVVDDIVTERAYTQFVATPLRIGRELTGGFPAVALIDHLDPVTIQHTTRIGRDVITAIGQIRSVDHEFKALGGTSSTRQVRWRAAVQVDIDERSTSSPMLPVEDLALDAVDESSAEFSWTNPTQAVTPTLTQIRIADTNEWIDIAYPSTSITWLGLRPATSYRFEIRLLREVDGVVEAVSPVRSVTFTTDVGVDGDGDGVIFDPPDPGCTVDVKLESSPDGTTWTVEATYTNVSYTTDDDGVSTYTPPAFSYDDDTLYRWCVRQVCGGTPSAWTCGAVFIGTCPAPSILATTPYDAAVVFVPKVCGLEIRDAISENVAATGTAFGGVGVDDAGNKALKSAAEGTVAYGVADVLLDVRSQSASIGIRVKLGSAPVGIVKLWTAAGLELQASVNGAGWSVSGTVYRDDGGTTTISDTAVLSLNTWYDLLLSHDVATGAITLRVDAVTVETGTYVGGRRMFLQAWITRLPDNSMASNAAVWDSVVVPAFAFDANDYGTVRNWWDAADLTTITTSGSDVTTWADKTPGTARDLVQNTAGERPRSGVDTVNGRNVISFDGTEWLEHNAGGAAAFNLHTPAPENTIFVVARPGNVSNPDALYTFLGNNANSSANRGIAMRWDDRSSVPVNETVVYQITRGVGGSLVTSTTLPDGTAPANTVGVFTATSDPVPVGATPRSTLRYNDGTVYTESVGGGAPATGDASFVFQVGAGGNDSFPFVGVICEVIIYTGILSASDITAVTNALRTKWGI